MSWEPPADPNLQALNDTTYRNWMADKPEVVAFDTETTGLTYQDTAFCVTFAWHSAREDMLRGGEIGVEGYYVELELPQGRELARHILDSAQRIVAHNAKFDLHKVEQALGWTLRPEQVLDDTEAMAHLDDEHRSKGLKSLAVSVLGFDDTITVGEKQVPKSKYEIDQARKWAKKHHGLASVEDVGYQLLPRGTVVPYAILDAVWTLNLARKLYPGIARYDDLLALYEAEMRLTRTAIYDMERAGMKVDTAYVQKQIRAYRLKCAKHENALSTIVGKPVRTGPTPATKAGKADRPNWFNPSASAPDTAAFFEAHNLGRDCYDAEALATIDHPLAATLLAYRKDIKILDGYFVSLQKETGPDGIFHTSIRQHGTVAGRTSMGKERGDQ